jgi:glycosyltransferase involved in cell wall biosynthesis
MKMSGKEKKLNGLFVLGTLYPVYTGGMEIFNYYFLNHQLSHSSESIYYLGENRTDRPGGHFILLKKRRPTRFFYPIQFFFAVLKLHKQLNYAYLSYAEQSWIISYVSSLTLRLFRIPYIVTIHWGKEPDWNFRYPYVSYFKHAHAVIGVSEPICIAFKKAIPGLDVIYIPPLIPFQRAVQDKSTLKKQLGFRDQEKILLYVGTLKPMKNPDKVVEAFRIIGPAFLKSHHIRLIFAGSGEMGDELRERVNRYDLGEYIRFEGLVSREFMPDYYKAADFYIISSDYEGTSLSLMEAMFNKLAIVGSDGPGINKMIQNERNALLYETKNINQLSDTLMRIFTDPELASELSEKAFADFNSQYSYEKMVERYESVFSTV